MYILNTNGACISLPEVLIELFCGVAYILEAIINSSCGISNTLLGLTTILNYNSDFRGNV